MSTEKSTDTSTDKPIAPYHLSPLTSIDNYPNWENGIKCLLMHHGLIVTLAEKGTPLPLKSLQDRNHARMLILSHISPEIQSFISPTLKAIGRPDEILTQLAHICRPTQVYAVTALLHKRKNTKLQDFSSVDAYILEHRRIHTRLLTTVGTGGEEEDKEQDDELKTVAAIIAGVRGHESLDEFVEALEKHAPKRILEIHAALNRLAQADAIGMKDEEWEMIEHTWSLGKSLIVVVKHEKSPLMQYKKSSPVTPVEGASSSTGRGEGQREGDTRRRGRTDNELKILYQNMFRDDSSDDGIELRERHIKRQRERAYGIDVSDRKLVARMYADDIIEGLGCSGDEEEGNGGENGCDHSGCACGAERQEVPEPLAFAIGAMMHMAAHEHQNNHHHHHAGQEDGGVVEIEGEENNNDEDCECMLCSSRRG